MPELSVGQGICDADGLGTYTITYVNSDNATLTVTNGTDNNNGTITATLASAVEIMASNGATCEVTYIVESPEDCTNPCTLTPISIGGVSCIGGTATYQIDFVLADGYTITNNGGGTLSATNDQITGLASGVDVVLILSHPSCPDRTITIEAPTCVIPDYRPDLFSGVSNVAGNVPTDISFVIAISEINDGNSNDVPVEIRISKEVGLLLTFDLSLTTLNGRTIDNSNWVFDETEFSRYTFKNNIKFEPGQRLFLGVNATYLPEFGSAGKFPLKVTIKAGAGGEVNFINNVDTDFINYLNN